MEDRGITLSLTHIRRQSQDRTGDQWAGGSQVGKWRGSQPCGSLDRHMARLLIRDLVGLRGLQSELLMGPQMLDTLCQMALV